MVKRPRIMPPVYLLAAAILMLAFHFLLPVRQLLGWPWLCMGLGLIAVGLSLGGWAVTAFVRHKTTIKPGDISSHLMTGGPFCLTRNPIYLSMVLILAAMAVLLGSLSPWAMIPMFMSTINRNIIPVEEAMLTETFGEAYRRYQLRVRRWI